MSIVRVVIEQPVTKVYVDRNSTIISQYTGQPVYPTIQASSPITYTPSSLTVGIDQSLININNTQVSGLGSASTRNVPLSGNASSNEVVLGNDSRLSSDSHMPFGVVTGVSGHYLVSMGSGVINQTIISGTLLYVPMYLSDPVDVNIIAVEVAASASEFGSVRLGIYDSNEKGIPGNLIVDAGTVNGSTVGVKQAVINATLQDLVWLAVSVQGGNVSLKCFTNTIQAFPSGTTGATSAGRLTLGSASPLFGTLPSVAPQSPLGTPYYPPLVNLRMT